MFDWDDQELADIIWGEGSEADDQIVHYPENTGKKDVPDHGDNDKRKLTGGDTNREAVEENAFAAKSFSDGGKGVSASRTMGAQHDFPSFSASRTHCNPIAKKTQLDIGLEVSQNQHEDKELGELVDNSWPNIGGFDDLDRIFSNDDLDGQASLGVDDLWSSSKDLASGVSKCSSQTLGSASWDFDALGNTSAHFEINSKYLLDENRSVLPGSRKTDAMSSYSERDFDECVQQDEYAGGTRGLVSKKENWPSDQSKHFLKMEKLRGSRLVADRHPSPAANVPQFDGHCAPATVQNYPGSVHHQQQQPQGSWSTVYPHFSNPCASTYAYGNFTHQYPAMHMVKPTDAEHQSMLSNSEACTGNVIALNQRTETSTKPVKMTPREKIEKLRRRQQMRAMLAIQLQQQQLGHRVSNVDSSLSQKSCQEDQVLNVEKADFEANEGASALPCYDPGSPTKRDDSSTISDTEDYSAEDTILYQFQDIIARLDLKIRLCIRDSLYRLAQNAMQRSYTNDAISTKSSMNEHGAVKEETSSLDRFARKVHVETNTNQIDRLVAHLLFHRPFKLSSKHADTPESSMSTKVSIDQKAADPNSMAIAFLTKNSENEYNLSPHDSKTSCPFVDSCEEDMFERHSSKRDKKQSTNEPEYGGA